jgi:hypothetical protein
VHARLQLVDHAEVVVVPDHAGVQPDRSCPLQMFDGFRSLTLSSLRWTPVRFNVRAIEKNAMAAVIASRGCIIVCVIALEG